MRSAANSTASPATCWCSSPARPTTSPPKSSSWRNRGRPMDRFSPPKIAQIELHCADLAAAEAFYCGVLGLAKVGQFVKCSEVNLITQASPNPKVPGSMIYFSADGAVREATAALQAQGVAFR